MLSAPMQMQMGMMAPQAGAWNQVPQQSGGQTGSGDKFPILGGIGALSGILGSLFGGKKLPDAATLRRLFGPQALSGDTQQLYDFLSRSPQFQGVLSQNNVNASTFQNNLAANLGARGLSTSGIGSIATAAGQSAGQFGEQSLRGGLFGTAGDLAQQNLMARLQAYQQFQSQQYAQPTGLQSLFGGIASAGSLAGGMF